MLEIYVLMVQKGMRKLDEIPVEFRDKVRARLEI